jgi:hypothetical protein
MHALTRTALVAVVATGLVAGGSALASAATSLTRVSTDPYTNPDSFHRTEVEPDTFAFGTTVVATFQVGRFTDGGASNIGWATSTDSGSTWKHGFLPKTTVNAQSPGPWARISDPSVAYDAKHATWIIATLAINGSNVGAGVLTSRSTNGGLTWVAPTTVTTAGSFDDKSWIACDNTAASPYYGRCYTEWDDNADGNRIKMSTSADGGLTWGPARNTADNATGLGGQPVVRANGVVVVPIDSANESALRVFRSTNGGASWGTTATVATYRTHTVAGGLRTGPLPSAEIDGAGRVYVVWQDCRFRASCSSNDIVLTSSADGVTWTAVSRIPIDATTSTVDHFVPGLAVNRATSGSTARLALAYYYYPTANCSSSTCRLYVGYVSSANGGTTWTAATQLAGPMTLSWLPATTQGRMFGDYISTSFVSGRAYPMLSIAKANAGTVFDQSMNVPTGGLAAAAGTSRGAASGASPAQPSAPAARAHARTLR